MADHADVRSLKTLLATGTRILYEHGLVDAFGHLSVRVPGHRPLSHQPAAEPGPAAT